MRSRPTTTSDGEHRHPVRTGPGAFGIGLVHGMGGSAGVGVLLLAAIPSETLAVVALLVLALFTAVSMTIVTTGFGAALGSRPVSGVLVGALPAIGLVSLAFGIWYAAAVWSLAPYRSEPKRISLREITDPLPRIPSAHTPKASAARPRATDLTSVS